MVTSLQPPIDALREIARAKGDDFDAILQEYLRAGIVLSNPLAMVLALPVTVDGHPAWFIKAAAGDIRLLAKMLLGVAFKPLVMMNRVRLRDGKIVGSQKPRVYSSRRMLELIT